MSEETAASGGVCSFRWFLLKKSDGANLEHFERSAAALGLFAAFLLVAATLFRAWAHTYAAFGSDAFAWESVRVIVLESPWGGRWLYQGVLSFALFASFVWLRAVHRTSGWVLASMAALGYCVSMPLLGHAAGHEPGPLKAIALQATHAVGATLWIGTLATLAIVALPKTPSGAISLLRAFGPVAMTGLGVLALSGGLTTLMYQHHPSDLWSSIYGRVLTGKLFLFLMVGACGASNWRRLRPDHEAERGIEDRIALHRRVVRIELAVALVVLLVTSVLTGLPQS